MADNAKSVTAVIDGDDEFTDWLLLTNWPSARRFFSVSVGGDFTATVTIQAKRPDWDDAAAIDIGEPIEAPAVLVGELVGDWHVRAGVKEGAYTSGDAEIVVAVR